MSSRRWHLLAGLALALPLFEGLTSAQAQQQPQPPELPVGVTATAAGVGSARCDTKGFFDNGRLTVELSGQADADPTGEGGVSATNVTCTLKQAGAKVLQTNMTRGGGLSGNSTTGSIPLAPTQVCASGFVVRTNGTAANPFDPKIALIPEVCNG